MGIWEFKDTENLPSRLNSYSNTCPFCSQALEALIESHSDEERESHSLYGRSIERNNTSSVVFVCQLCGWWKINGKYTSDNGRNFYIREVAAAAKLFTLNLQDVNQPLEEVRTYLLGKYEQRFSINPYLFEKTVGSVFGSLGYNSVVTGKHNDGGIDVILEKNNELTGVQVKRWRDDRFIGVSQVRELVGALVLKGVTKGMFVTTSDYQSGCSKVANQARVIGTPIELLNASSFYSALSLAQRPMFKSKEDFIRYQRLIELTVVCEYEEARGDNTGDDDDYDTDWFSRYI